MRKDTQWRFQLEAPPQQCKVRGGERGKDRGSRGWTPSPALSSIMAPIGLKAVVGESKIFFFQIILLQTEGGCGAALLRANAVVCACVCMRVCFGRLRMSAIASGWGWGWRWWRWCSWSSIVSYCKPRPCSEGDNLQRLCLSRLPWCGCAIVKFKTRKWL